MPDPGVILWDFEGTLGERPGGWSALLVETLDAEMPGHEYSTETFRPFLRDGFPWHVWETPHPETDTADAWWVGTCGLLTSAFARAGLAASRSATLAEAARWRYLNPATFIIYDDCVPALERLAEIGWRHAILSNHIPELAEIIGQSPLRGVIDWVISSGVIGFEKPHPDAFSRAATLVGGPVRWMVGDNPVADILGARQAGLQTLLVRRDDGQTRPFAADLHQAADFILRASVEDSARDDARCSSHRPPDR